MTEEQRIVYTDETGTKLTEAEILDTLEAHGLGIRNREAEWQMPADRELLKRFRFPRNWIIELVRAGNPRAVASVEYQPGEAVKALAGLLDRVRDGEFD